jgi:hypothetical protein
VASPVSGEASPDAAAYRRRYGTDEAEGPVPMTRMMIRVDAEISDELSGAFPHLTARTQRATTTLTGEMADQEELQGVLNLLNSLGISVVEVVTIPD